MEKQSLSKSVNGPVDAVSLPNPTQEVSNWVKPAASSPTVKNKNTVIVSGDHYEVKPKYRCEKVGELRRVNHQQNK